MTAEREAENRRRLKGAIFDADGTLLSSMHIWEEVGARYLARFGIEAEKDLYRILFPMTLEESSVYMKERYGLPEPPEKIRAGFIDIIARFYREEVQLKEGAAAYLRTLREKGIPAVIATTGDEELLRAALERLHVRECFSGILTCTGLQTSKHEQKIYLKAAEYMEIDIREAAVFEDVLYAVKSAKNAGAYTVGVEDAASAGDRNEIRELSDLYVRSFRDPALFRLFE